MPERKDARTPEKFLILISKNHHPHTPHIYARVLPNPFIIIIINDINRISRDIRQNELKNLSKFVRKDKKTAKNYSKIAVASCSEKRQIVSCGIPP
jgi:hypothetical protein